MCTPGFVGRAVSNVVTYVASSKDKNQLYKRVCLINDKHSLVLSMALIILFLLLFYSILQSSTVNVVM